MTLEQFFDATGWPPRCRKPNRPGVAWWLRNTPLSADDTDRIWLIKVSPARYYLQILQMEPHRVGYSPIKTLRQLVPMLVTYMLTHDLSDFEDKEPNPNEPT